MRTAPSGAVFRYGPVKARAAFAGAARAALAAQAAWCLQARSATLSGDGGGGMFLVRRTGPSAGGTVWWNTNFEIRLGDGWWLVEQD